MEFEIRAAKEPVKAVKVIINGIEYLINVPELSYEEMCELVGIPVSMSPSVVYSIKVSSDTYRTGTAYKGKSVPIQEGAIYNVCVTGAA